MDVGTLGQDNHCACCLTELDLLYKLGAGGSAELALDTGYLLLTSNRICSWQSGSSAGTNSCVSYLFEFWHT